MNIQKFLGGMGTLNKLDTLIDIADQKIVEQVRVAAQSQGLLPDDTSDDKTLSEATKSVFSIVPPNITHLDPDTVRIQLGDRYDALPYGVSSRILALGMLAYARGVIQEVANRHEVQLVRDALAPAAPPELQ